MSNATIDSPNRHRVLWIVMGVLLFFTLCAGNQQKDQLEAVTAVLRCRVTALQPDAPAVRSKLVRQPESARDFYARRGYRPAWSNGDTLFDRTDELVAAIDESEKFGLLPVEYHQGRIAAKIAGLTSASDDDAAALAGRLAALDLILTDSFLNLASDLLYGRPEPTASVPDEWILYRDVIDFAIYLENMIGMEDIGGALKDLFWLNNDPRTDTDFEELLSRLSVPGAGPTQDAVSRRPLNVVCQ
jgi:hypothetical protein